MSPELRSGIESVVATLEGWCSLEKALAMVELILDTRPEVVVEVGVFGGKSLIPQALALAEAQRGCIYGIDPWKKEAALEGSNDPANDDWWARVDLAGIHQRCAEAVWSRGLDRHAVLIRAPSLVAVNLFANTSVDVLYLDGNHSQECSTADVKAWLPKVKPLGFIWFDDTDWATTKKAFGQLKARLNYIRDVGTCALFHKAKLISTGHRKDIIAPLS